MSILTRLALELGGVTFLAVAVLFGRCARGHAAATSSR